MSATFLLFAPLSPQEMRELEVACERAVEAYLEEHPDCDDRWGEIIAGGAIPTRQEVLEGYGHYDLDLDDETVARLDACRSALIVDRPGDFETDRLQVTVLRFLFERAGRGLVMFNDYPLVSTEEAIEMLRGMRGVQGFATETPKPTKRPVKARKARPGEVRAIRVLERLSAAVSDPAFAIDVRRSLERSSDAARQYASLLMTDGAMDDAQAARELGLAPAELAREADALAAALDSEEE